MSKKRQASTKRASRPANAAFKAKRASSMKPFTTNKSDIGHTFTGINHAHKDAKLRPYLLWSMFFDESLDNLVGVEGIERSTSQKHFYYTNNLIIPDQGTRTAVQTTNTAFFNNTHDHVNIVQDQGHSKFLPDLILRRVYGLLHNPTPQDYSVSSKLNKGRLENRRGVWLKTISVDEVLGYQDGKYIPTDVLDSPVEQMGYVQRGFLDQNNIDEISLIARHFSQYCIDHGLNIIWPKPGTYPDWPEDFLAFADPNLDADSVNFSWYPPPPGRGMQQTNDL